MKTFLKFAGVFVLGLVIGFGVSIYYSRNYLINFFTTNFAEHTMMDVGFDIMKLQMYRQRTESGERFFETIEKSIPEHILTIEKDEKLKTAWTYKSLLENAKEFYVCTKTDVPKEIEEIINNVKLNDDFECQSDTTENNEKGKE